MMAQMNSEEWNPPKRIEQQYRSSLVLISNRIIKIFETTANIEEFVRLAKEFSQDPQFIKYSYNIARRLVTQLHKNDSIKWKQMLKAKGKKWQANRHIAEFYIRRMDIEKAEFFNHSNEMYEAFMEYLQGGKGAFLEKKIQQNAARIVTLPADIANDVSGWVAQQAIRGVRAFEIAEEIQNWFPEYSHARAEMIARTEVSTINTQITQMQSIDAGVNCYQWRASGGGSGDGRTRYSHKKFSGVIVFWDEAPAPEDLFPMYTQEGVPYKNSLGHYHAGCCPNCRCVAMPIAYTDDLVFPVRVYRGGQIVKMGERALNKLIGA